MPRCSDRIELDGVVYECELDEGHVRANGPVMYRKQHVRVVEADERTVTILWPRRPSSHVPEPEE